MAFVHCRECGHEIKADTKATRCDKCGSFFPFTCAVCDKYLRPPFDVYDDERYVNDDSKPLCQDHYQRQCPECHKWFQADENPGYFLCLNCAKTREERVVSATSTSTSTARTTVRSGSRSADKESNKSGARTRPAPDFDSLVLAAIGGAGVLGVLFFLYKLIAG
jgi:Zn finger protein HypA/HybF involved in hydrogenase expression